MNESGAVIELFHPRRHAWAEHFRIDGPRIAGISAIGEATVRVLRMNLPERIEERRHEAI